MGTDHGSRFARLRQRGSTSRKQAHRQPWNGSVATAWARIGASLATALLASLAAHAATDAPEIVDYRHYALDSWIGAIGLPDDSFKCVVDADGRFMTELGKSKGHQGVYPDPPAQNRVVIHADLLGGTARVDQHLVSARVPIAITRKRQGDITVTEYLFLAKPLDWSANLKGTDLRGHDSRPDSRQYLLMTEYANQGAKSLELTPVIHVTGGVPTTKLDDSRRSFGVSANTRCRVSRDIASFQGKKPNQGTLELEKIAIQPGEKSRWVLAIDRNGFGGSMPADWAEAERLRNEAVAYWEKSAAIPYDVIQVPDREIQAILDTSIRELYQMRYVIRGLPAYFFGPGVYNDYWILDGSFVTEAMDLLGRVEDASGYADYLLLHQQGDGRIQCMQNHWKETGIALVTLYRHARMVRDKVWLLQRWPQFTRAVEAIRKLRRTGSSADPRALNYRLSPVGFGDGGIGNEAEYTNNHWLLAGMKGAIEAAQWLDKPADAKAWEKEFRDFDRAFHEAIDRDAKTDAYGNRYIPAVMGSNSPKYPTRGQWAFCQGVYPGRIFAKDDPLMLGTMKMLAAHEVQGGIVENSGWIGIWAQCGSFYGHDWLWLGEGEKASRLLYAFANHASPLRNWREEMPRQTRPRERFPFHKGGGDMPHVSAAAEFVRLTAHLLAFDRDSELHLLEGLPKEWLKPGAVIRIKGMQTPFGPLTVELRVTEKGDRARLSVQPLPAKGECNRLVVHLPGGGIRESNPTEVQELSLEWK